jgi:hypothetical protein
VDGEGNVDEAMSAASGGTERAVVLAEPTCSALGVPARQPTPRRDVAAGALRLVDTVPAISELTEGVIESLDDLIVGVVEAVEECVLAPPPDCPNLCAHAEVEAASWVDDFIADDATNGETLVSQQVMFQLACVVADAVAEALAVGARVRDRPSNPCGLRLEPLDLGRVVDEIRRLALDAVRWSVRLARPLTCLRN